MTEITSNNELIELVGAIIRINQTIKTSFSAVNSEFGIAPVEAMVLSFVTQSPENCTVSQIGRYIFHGRQTVQRAAFALEKAQLIEFLDNPNHKRAPLLRATRKGRQLSKRIQGKVTSISENLLQYVDRQRCAEVAQELRDLGATFEEAMAQTSASSSN